MPPATPAAPARMKLTLEAHPIASTRSYASRLHSGELTLQASWRAERVRRYATLVAILVVSAAPDTTKPAMATGERLLGADSSSSTRRVVRCPSRATTCFFTVLNCG